TAESILSRARYCTNCWERTQEEQTCNRKRAAEDIEVRARRELQEAERVLSSTPAWLTRDVYRTVSYRNVQHRFRVPGHGRVAVGGVPRAERGGVFAFESVEREGVPVANIASLPYSEPTQAQRRAELAKIAFEQAQAAVSAELDRLSDARLAVCPAPEE